MKFAQEFKLIKPGHTKEYMRFKFLEDELSTVPLDFRPVGIG